MEKTDLWSALAAPLAPRAIAWRQDGRAVARDGRWFARFVAYVDANTVRERLDAVVPGEWDLTLDLLPPVPGREDDEGAHGCSFKARLQILGVIREDVGTGRDYKAAATDAFKRAAVRFGIGHELYALDQNWVEVDGEGRHARALEDPQVAYDRRAARRAGERGERGERPVARAASVEPSLERAADEHAHDPIVGGSVSELPACPKCGGRVWDNRLTKRNPKAPDYKCRDRSCDGVIWPARGASAPDGAPEAAPEPEPTPSRPSRRSRVAAGSEEVVLDASPLGASGDGDDLPF